MNHLERPFNPVFGLHSAMYTEAETIRLLRSAGFVRCRRRRDLAGSWRYLTMVAYKAADAARPLNGTRRPEIGASEIGAPVIGASGKIGRPPWRETVCQYVYISVVALSLNKKQDC